MHYYEFQSLLETAKISVNYLLNLLLSTHITLTYLNILGDVPEVWIVPRLRTFLNAALV